MLQRTSIRTRVLAGFAVPVAALVVVGTLDLGPSLGLGLVVAAVAGAAILLAIAITASITRPITVLTEQVMDLNVMQRLGRKVSVDEMLMTRDARGGFDGELGQLSNAIAEGRRRGIETVSAERAAHDAIKELATNCATRTDMALNSAIDACAVLIDGSPYPAISLSLESVHGAVLRSERHTAGLLELLGSTAHQQDRASSVATVVANAVLSCDAAGRIGTAEIGDAYLDATTVNDMTNLLGELIDNAANATASGGSVTVSGATNDVGYVVTIVNEGEAMDSRSRDVANKRVARVLATDLLPTKSIGLDVVGRIARRHEIDVQVVDPAEGTSAVRVQIPWSKLTFAPAPKPRVEPAIVVAATETSIATEVIPEPQLVSEVVAEVAPQPVLEPLAVVETALATEPVVARDFGVVMEPAAVAEAVETTVDAQAQMPPRNPFVSSSRREAVVAAHAEPAPRKKRWAAALANADR